MIMLNIFLHNYFVEPRFIYLTTVKQIEKRYELLIYHANAEKNSFI